MRDTNLVKALREHAEWQRGFCERKDGGNADENRDPENQG